MQILLLSKCSNEITDSNVNGLDGFPTDVMQHVSRSVPAFTFDLQRLTDRIKLAYWENISIIFYVFSLWQKTYLWSAAIGMMSIINKQYI